MKNNQPPQAAHHANHDSAAPRQHPLICTGAEPIHQVHGQPTSRAPESMLRNRITIPPFSRRFALSCVHLCQTISLVSVSHSFKKKKWKKQAREFATKEGKKESGLSDVYHPLISPVIKLGIHHPRKKRKKRKKDRTRSQAVSRFLCDTQSRFRD